MIGPPEHGERGSVTLFVLGLCVMMLFVGGISLDLWRAFSERRALASAADAAAVAGASGIDTDVYRTTGKVRLDPSTSEALAWDNLRRQEDIRSLVDATVDATSTDVTVTATGRVDFTLLRIFLSREDPFRVSVRATAEPKRSS
ncbi:MAG: pilus assembly protein TadG-related protein [Acidimicrobiia bacterium]